MIALAINIEYGARENAATHHFLLAALRRIARLGGSTYYELIPSCNLIWRHNIGTSMTYGHKGRGDGTPLQFSCLENPMDGGAW